MNNLAHHGQRDGFDTFLVDRIAASDRFIAGDADPLKAVSSHLDPATIFPPSGAQVVGAAAVDAANAQGAAGFEPGGTNEFVTIHQGSSGELAYWVGTQRSTVRVKGVPDAVPMTLRLTELYRRENGSWKLFHRHADSAAG
mgnify:CR=1 FL=1